MNPWSRFLSLSTAFMACQPRGHGLVALGHSARQPSGILPAGRAHIELPFAQFDNPGAHGEPMPRSERYVFVRYALVSVIACRHSSAGG